MPDLEALRSRYVALTGSEPEGLWFGPGRVNLIGEPLEGDLLVAAPVDQLLQAAVGEVHGRQSSAVESRRSSCSLCTLAEPTDGADDHGLVTGRMTRS